MLGYIADFYCPAARLIIEIDGAGQDAGRDAAMQRYGLRVLRVTHEDVQDRFAFVVEQIRFAMQTGGPLRPLGEPLSPISTHGRYKLTVGNQLTAHGRLQQTAGSQPDSEGA